MSKSKDRKKFEARLPIYRTMASMPVLNHWPDRSIPFDHAKSEVLQFIAKHGVDLKEAQLIFGGAGAKGLIVFDQETKLWKGTGDTSQLDQMTACSTKKKRKVQVSKDEPKREPQPEPTKPGEGHKVQVHKGP